MPKTHFKKIKLKNTIIIEIKQTAVNYYQKVLHLRCCSSLRSASTGTPPLPPSPPFRVKIVIDKLRIN